MNNRKTIQRIFKMVTPLFYIMLTAIVFTEDTEAQIPAPFLSTPYYGSFAISQGYNQNHRAYDFLLRYDPVLSGASGTIEHVGWFNHDPRCIAGVDDAVCGYGLHIRVQHLAANSYRTIYAHLSATGFDLDPNDIGTGVGLGQVIGTSGSTGWSTGPHLHFEVRNQNNQSVDPFNPNLWKDGEHVGRPLPKPPTNGEIIVDDNPNNGGGFSKGRNDPFNTLCPPNNCPNWSRVTGSGGAPDYMYGGDMYHTSVNNTDYWAKWEPAGLTNGGGMYEVFVHVPNANSTTWQAAYTIVHTFGQTTGRVAQGSLPNAEFDNSQWVSIGTYHMEPGDYVFTTGTTGDLGQHCTGSCRLGVDAIKFVRLGSIFVPDIHSSGGWSSQINISSNSGTAHVSVAEYTSSGAYLGRQIVYIPLYGSDSIYPYNANTASVVVDATQDTVVSILMEHNSPFASTAYVGVEEAKTNLFVPLVHRNNYGWNSEISLHNAGVDTQVQVEFIPGTAGSACTQSQWVAANGTWRLYTAGLSCLGSTFIGSARVTSASPIASADLQYRPSYASLIGSASVMEANGNLYAPLIQNNNVGWTSGFTLQNATGSWRTHTAQYFRPGGASCRTDSYWVGPYQLAVVYPAPPAGCGGDGVLSAGFASSGAMNAQVNQIIAGGDPAAGYPAIALPTTKAIVPYVRKDANWHTGVQIRNASTGSASVTIRYYDSNGAVAGNQSFSIPGNGFKTLYPASPTTTFYGSAVVESTNGRNIAVVVNHLKVTPGASGDVLMSHIAPGR